MNPSVKLFFILSEPRSGSTVLSAMLDRCKGVICLPESSFPQVLGMMSGKDRADPRWMAALYIGSTLPNRPVPSTPLSLDEAASCMKGSNREILINLGLALAGKIGRDPAKVTTVIWKTTKTIGMHKGPLSTGGDFIILRRNRLNVFESQQRIYWGVNNRNPFRYALFAQSYEQAFSRLPKQKTFHLEYEAIPQRFSELLASCGIVDQGEWEGSASSIDLITKNAPWLTRSTESFRNTDPEKRAVIGMHKKIILKSALHLSRLLRPLLGAARGHFDKKALDDIIKDSKIYYAHK